MSPRRLSAPALALASALAGCGPPPSPSRAAAEAKARCDADIPEPRPDAPLEPLNAGDLFGLDERQAGLAPRFGFFALARPPAAPREGPGGPVEFRLSARPVVAAGEELNVALSAVNRSPAPVALLRPLDDSDLHWRFPHYDLYLRPEGSNRTFAYAMTGTDRCGWVNQVGPEDYVELAPGQAASLPVYHWVSHEGGVRLRRPGRYVLWAVYRFCGYGVGVGGGPVSDGQHGDVRRADAVFGEFASNPVAVEVR